MCDGARGRQLHPVTAAPTTRPLGILLCFFSGQGSTVRAQLTLAQGPQGPGETGGCSPECCWGGGEWTSQSAGPRPAAIQSLTPLPPHTILGQITGQGEPRCGAQASSRTRMTGTPLAERPAHTATPCTSCRPRGVMQGSEATTHGIRGVTGLTPLILGSFPGCGGAGQVVGAQSVAVSMGTVTPRPTAQGWEMLLPRVAPE